MPGVRRLPMCLRSGAAAALRGPLGAAGIPQGVLVVPGVGRADGAVWSVAAGR